jgi:hypothetical protein
MTKMRVNASDLLELLSQLLNRLTAAMVWLNNQPEKLEIPAPDHLESTVKGIPIKDGHPCLLIRKQPTDDEALFEVLKLVLGAMGVEKPTPRRAATRPGSRKRR